MSRFQKAKFSTAIASLEKTHRSKQQHKAEMLESLLLDAGVPADVAAMMALKLKPEKIENWRFVMLSPKEKEAVGEWIEKNSTQPIKAFRVLDILFANLDWKTGEVKLARKDLATRVGIRPNHLSKIMSELASINAIRREYNGRGVTYFLNPNIATHIPSPEKREAARKGVKPVLKVVENKNGEQKTPASKRKKAGHPPDKKRKEAARHFLSEAASYGFDDATMDKIRRAAKQRVETPDTAEGFGFVMLDPAQNASVICWLHANAKHPQNAAEVWSLLLTRLDWETGEILQTRKELAEKVGIDPQNLSGVITELCSINALRCERDGREIRLFLNPNIATHIPSAEKREAARKGVKPVLSVVENKDED